MIVEAIEQTWPAGNIEGCPSNIDANLLSSIKCRGKDLRPVQAHVLQGSARRI